MANILSKLKKSTSVEKLTKAVDNLNKKSYEDDRFWKLERDKSGNASAVIRFLPAAEADGEDALPWVRYWDHGIRSPHNQDKFYINKSLTTLDNGADPVTEFNSKLWKLGKGDKNSPECKYASENKRRLNHVCNILVISDPLHPENEGQVRLFKFGKKIFDMITEKMKPKFGDTPINPFDMLKGANFHIRMQTIKKIPNYDPSKWEDPSPVSEDEKELERIYNSLHQLSPLVASDQFKSYDQLKKEFDTVMGFDTSKISKIEKFMEAKKLGEVYMDDDSDDEENEESSTVKAVASDPRTSKFAPALKEVEKKFSHVSEELDEDDDAPFDIDSDELKRFKELAG